MGNRLVIEVNGSEEICEMLRSLVLQNPQNMRIIEDNLGKENIRLGNLEMNLISREVWVEEKKIAFREADVDVLEPIRLWLPILVGCLPIAIVKVVNKV